MNTAGKTDSNTSVCEICDIFKNLFYSVIYERKKVFGILFVLLLFLCFDKCLCKLRNSCPEIFWTGTVLKFVKNIL